MAERLNFDVPRNGQFTREFQFKDNDDQAIDLTGHTLEMKAQSIAGDGTILATATITVTEAGEGKFEVQWDGSDFDSYGEVTALTRAAYDLKWTNAASDIDVPLRGFLNLIPEATP